MGRLREAQKVLTKLQDHEKYADRAQYYLGIVAYELGKYKNAVLRLRKHLENHPDSARVYARMGMAYLQLGEIAKAREACSRALAIDGDDLQARWTLGCALLEEGVLDEAARIFREILRDAPDHLPAFQETVRMRFAARDDRWLRQALRSEVTSYERLPVRANRAVPGRQRSIEVDPRAVTRDRIGVILRALEQLDDDQVPSILETMDLTTDEGLRFLLWEAALDKLGAIRARRAARALREPGGAFSAAAGREILALASVLPEAVLTRGLAVDEEHLSRAAVDRHPPAADVETHRNNVERERQEARAWQALLLLAVATRHTRSARNLLLRWTVDADPELADAARAALAVWGDPHAAEHLRVRARARGADQLVDQLLEAITPPESTVQPRPVSDDEEVTCATCGRRAGEVGHLLVGSDAAVCNLCLMHVARNRRELATDDPSVRCALSGRAALESRGMYVYNGVPVSAECVENSLGLLEREEVDRFLASW
jgi:tetratricopeptide (TPR) repeat protein